MSLLLHAQSEVHRKGDLVDTKRYWTPKATTHDPVKLLIDDESAELVVNVDEPLKIRSSASVDGALERSCGVFLVFLKQKNVLVVTFDRAEATARVFVSTMVAVVCSLKRKQQHGWTCPQLHDFLVSFLLNSFMDGRETGWFSRDKQRHFLGSSLSLWLGPVWTSSWF